MKLAETFPARVTTNDDPDKRGRIKVACVGLLGDEETELPTWVEPVCDWGWFYVPDVGEQVDIEVTSASESDESFGQMSIDNLKPKWRGGTYKTNSEVDASHEARPVPDDFTTNYGKRRGFATPGGHVLMFDDTKGQRKITLTWADGDGGFSYLGFDESGSIIMGNKNGSMLFLNAALGEMSLIDEHGNMVASDANGIKVIDANGDLVDLSNGAIQILAQSALTISAPSANIDAGRIDLGGSLATDFAVLGNVMLAAFNAHLHTGVTTGPGVSGIPDAASIAAMAAAVSANVRVKP